MVRWQTIYGYMERKETSNEQIIKVLSFILSKIDTLEIEQSRHKEMFYKVRKNLTDANDLINQGQEIINMHTREDTKLKRKFDPLSSSTSAYGYERNPTVEEVLAEKGKNFLKTKVNGEKRK